MSIAELIYGLKQKGVSIKLIGADLEISAANPVVDPELLSLLKNNKAGIVAYLTDAATVEDEPIPRIALQPSYELSQAQKRLWIIDQLVKEKSAFHISGSYELKGRLDRHALERAFEFVIDRHESLRTIFVVENGVPRQMICSRDEIGYRMYHKDLRRTANKEEQLLALATEVSDNAFDLADGPLLRTALAQLSDQRFVFLMTMHHIISDAWSMEVLIRELLTMYDHYAYKRGKALPHLRVQYKDYAAWQNNRLHNGSYRAHRDFWKKQLDDAPPPVILPGKPAIGARGHRGHTITTQFDRELVELVKHLNTLHENTFFVSLFGAVNLLLYMYSDQTDIVTGVPTAGREHKDLEGQIGFFINMMPVRVQIDGSASGDDFLGSLKKHLLACFHHSHYPYLLLQEEVRDISDAGDLFNIMIQVDHIDAPAASTAKTLEGIETGEYELPEKTSKYDMSFLFLVDAENDGIRLSVEYRQALFEPSLPQRFIEDLKTLIRALAANTSLAVQDLKKQVRGWAPSHPFALPLANTTHPKAVHHCFEEAVQQYPHAVAIQSEQGSLTYTALNQRANQLAHLLQQLITERGGVVAVLQQAGHDQAAGMLAVMKAGDIYFPVNTGLPPARIQALLDDTRPLAVITTTADCMAGLQYDQYIIVWHDGQVRAIHHGKELIAVPPSAPEWLHDPLPSLQPGGYIMYTSGSTGMGKPILGSLTAISHFVQWECAEFNIDNTVRVSQLSGLHFDASLRDFFVALSTGGCVCIPSPADRTDMVRLAGWLQQNGITVVHCVPTLMRLLLRELKHHPQPFPSLQLLVLAGEQLYNRDIMRWQQVAGAQMQVVNMYGASEVTMAKTFHRCLPVDEDQAAMAVPAGQPIPETQVAVISQGMVCQPGEIGEIFIKTAHGSCGYYQNAAATAGAFVQNPLVTDRADIVYRTGDLGRYRPDGALEVLGRRDEQVKLNGMRVELGELAAVVLKLPAVEEVIFDLQYNTGGEPSLVCYYVSAGVTERELEQYLQQTLPLPVQPQHIMRLSQLPVGLTGKVDRKALPRPSLLLVSQEEYEPVQGEVESRLEAIWQEVLQLSRIGRQAPFFRIGGTSLRAIQVISRIFQVFGVTIQIKDFFNPGTIARLAALIQDSTAGNYAPIPVAPVQPHYPLSHAQKRLWIIDQLEGDKTAYNISSGYELRGRLNRLALERSFRYVIHRHESLRTSFIMEEGDPRQKILSAGEAAYQMKYEDLRTYANREERLKERAQQESEKSFDLSCGPLIRTLLIQLSDERFVLLLTMHHIISDGWSMEVLIREILMMYDHFVNDTVLQEQPLRIQYKDYAIWQNRQLYGASYEQHRAYWTKQLEGPLPVLQLPTDFRRPEVRSNNGALLEALLPPALLEQVKSNCRQAGVSLFTFLLSSVNVLLHRYTGQNDIIVGTSIAGRDHVELEDQIGFYINMLALRTQISGEDKFNGLLQRMHITTMQAYEHRLYPFDELIEELGIERDMSRMPVFDITVTLLNTDVQTRSINSLQGVEVTEYATESTISKYDLVFNFLETEEGLVLNLYYNTDLFSHATMNRMLQHYERLLQSLANQPNQQVSAVNYLSVEEREVVIESFNDTQTNRGANLTMVDLFEQTVNRCPHNTALLCETATLTYEQLNAKSNQLCHYLRLQYDIHADDLVGIIMDRSEWMIISILGVLKAGAGYVPIDPRNPAERIRFILDDAHLKILLADSWNMFNEALIGSYAGALFVPDLNVEELQNYAAINPEPVCGPGNIAYVIYTSGSTGKPKGCLVQHNSNVNMALSQIEEFRISGNDKVLQFASLSFDASVYEIFMTFYAGASLVLLPAGETILEPGAFLKFLKQYEVSIVTLPPSYLLQFSAKEISFIRIIITAGEAANVTSVTELSRYTTCYNAYGPSECAVCVSFYKVSPADKLLQRIPIGKPISNLQLYVLDDALAPVPIGVPGEICVSGVGLARGYLHREDLTSQKFVANPFIAGQRLYRTGDIGRWLENGNLDYITRKDTQVKLRGHRVELEEIEKVMEEYKGIEKALVDLRGSNENKFLAAYFSGDQLLSSPAIIRFLAARLPAYMVPSFVIWLDKFPVTINGKINRSKLPEPGLPLVAGAAFMAPSTALEKELAAIWEEVLERDPVGIKDNFFELGGHSVRAVRIVSNIIKKTGVAIDLKDIFNHPTIEELASVIGTRNTVAFQQIPLAEPSDTYPLSHAQKRLWIISQIEEQKSTYNVSSGYVLRGELNRQALEQAFDFVIDRHESLRTVFLMQGADPCQKICTRGQIGYRMHFIDLVDMDPTGDKCRQIAAGEAAKPFDLATGPLIRTALVALAPNRHVFLLTMHHIISDGWSMEVLIGELLLMYQQFVDGKPAGPEPLRIQYKDYTIWQNRQLQGNAYERHRKYWKTQLAGQLPVLALPADHRRPEVKHNSGAVLNTVLPAALHRQVAEMSRQRNVSLFMWLLAGVKVLLHRYSGQQDIIVGTPIAGREHAELEDQIGFYVNTLALRTNPEGHRSFDNLLQQVRDVTLQAYEHQLYPFDELVEELGVERDMSRMPVFDVIVALLNTDIQRKGPRSLQSIEVEEYGAGSTVSKFDLTFNFQETEKGIALQLEYSTALFSEARMKRLLGHYQRIVEEVVKDAGQPIAQINYLDAEEYKQLTQTFNATGHAYPSGATLVSLFEEQVRRTPYHTAVIFEEKRLSYEELNTRSNQLAHYLRAQYDIQPNDLVGIQMDRSEWLIVSILGILKAGAGYVPVDPSYPPERQQYIRTHAQVKCVLTNERIDLPAAIGRLQPDTVLPHHTAYVIYTSGTTGQPKGCVIDHAAAANYLQWAAHYYSSLGAQGHYGLFSSLSFDFTLTSIFCPLITGNTLQVFGPGLAVNDILSQVFSAGNAIDIVKLTPSQIGLLPQLDVQQTNVRVVIAGGEALTEKHVRILHQIDASISIVNEYGPTEATVGCVTKRIQYAGSGVAIGLPIHNMEILVLDENLQLQPIGVPGEICIGGAGLARGYLNDPALTARKFIAHPFKPAQRIYRSGDLGKWTEAGELHYLGRVDDQVKIRGYRVEPGEIEAMIGQYPGVSTAVVSIAGQGEDAQINAWYQSDGPIQQEALRSYLAARLPAYMLPAQLTRVAALPLTVNGKIDKERLPQAGAGEPKTTYLAPSSKLEALLATIWQEVLECDEIGIRDNFFDRGGHSIKAIRMAIRTYKAGYKLDIKDIFNHPTIEQLAALIQSREQSVIEQIPVAPQAGVYELSHAQKRIWVMDQMVDERSSFHVTGGYELRGQLNRKALEQAFEFVIDRHEALRTIFILHDNTPCQKVCSRDETGYRMRYEDLGTATDKEEQLRQVAAEEAEISFDLARGPLIRTTLVQLAEDHFVFLLTMHHIIADAWSMEVLVNDLLTLYERYAHGRGKPLPPLRIQYKDYTVWHHQQLHSDKYSNHRTFWKKQLEGMAPLVSLPGRHTDRAPGHRGHTITTQFDRELVELVKHLNTLHENTFFVSLFGAVNLLLYLYSDQTDIVTGVPTAGREHKDLEGQIGFFINMMPVRVQIDPATSGSDYLRWLKDSMIEYHRYSSYPYLLLYEQLKGYEGAGHHDLFNVLIQVDYVNNGSGPAPAALEGVTVENFSRPDTSSKYDISFLFLVDAENDGIRLSVEYRQALFEPSLPQRFIEDLITLIRALAANTSLAVQDLKKQVRGWAPSHPFALPLANTTHPKAVHHCFEEAVQQYPHAVAIQSEQGSLTYTALNQRANQLAHLLQQLITERGGVVAVLQQAGHDQAAGMLAVMKAGDIYFPVNTGLPPARIQALLDDTRPLAVITTTADCMAGLQYDQYIIVWHDGQVRAIHHGKELIAVPPSAPEWLHDPLPSLQPGGYIMYTSGSTGMGKPILGSLTAISHFVQWECAEFNIDNTVRVSQLSGLHFDASLRDFFVALSTGGCVCIPSPADRTDMVRLAGWLQQNGITVVHCVPTLMRLLLRELKHHPQPFPSLQLLVLAGEQLYNRDIMRWQQVAGAQMQVVNMYGASEVTMAKTFHRCLPVDEDQAAMAVPAGQPIPETQVAVISQGMVCQPGEIGEIFIKTAHGSCGYYQNAAATAGAFVQNPLVTDRADIVYRTGDLGRYRPDGALEVLGRRDEQVKLNGMRVELGELAAVVLKLPAVEEVIFDLQYNTGGEPSLVCYYVSAGVTEQDLEQYLQQTLPLPVQPQHIMRLSQLPVGLTGKVDRKALPRPSLLLVSQEEYEPVQGGVESRLEAIWQEVLQLSRIGRQAPFFRIGGTSLRAIQVISRIFQVFGVTIQIKDFFNPGTIARLAALIQDSTAGNYAPIPVAPVQPHYPLSHAQKRLWIMDQLLQEQSAFNMSMGFEVTGKMDHNILSLALNTLLKRHESLRTNIVVVDGEPRQRITGAEDCNLTITYHDLRQHPHARATARELAAAEALLVFRLDRDPLIRCKLLQTGNDRLIVLFTIHHIICDGWSVHLLFAELICVYNACNNGQPNPLKPLRIHYKDYAAWQHQQLQSDAMLAHRSYWTEQFRETLPVLELPVDYYRGQDQTARGSRENFIIPAHLAEKINRQLTKHDVTLFMYVLSSVSVLLYRYTGQPDMVIGTASNGRLHVDLEDQVGLYVNLLPLKIQLNPSEQFTGVLEQIKTTTLAAFEHEVYPFDCLVDDLEMDRNSHRSPLFDVVVQMQERQWIKEDHATAIASDMEIADFGYDIDTSKYDLTFNFYKITDTLIASIEYNSGLFKQDTIIDMSNNLLNLLELLCDNDNITLDDRAILYSDQEKSLFDDFTRPLNNIDQQAK